MMKMNIQVEKVYIAFILLWNIRVSLVTAVTYEDAYAIESCLLKNYSTSILPVNLQTDRMYVHVDLYLKSISGLNELTGQLTTTLGLSLFWNDSQLTWDPTLFGGLSSIDIESSKVWTPDIMLANAGRKLEILGEERSKLFVFHNGSVSWVIMDVMYTVCDVDVTYFPFDTQVCNAEFVTWAYNKRFNFRFSKSEVNLFLFTENGVWSLAKTNVKTFFYESEHSPHILTATLYLQRRSAFYALSLLAPIHLLVLLKSAVFLLPAECGERVGFSVTILLSITVYMTIVADTLPDTSKPASILIYILALTLLQSSIICFETILGLRIYYRDNTKSVTKGWLTFARIAGCDFYKRKRNIVTEFTDDQSQDVKDNNKIAMGSKVTWVDIANLLDKVFFMSSVIISITISLVYICLVGFAESNI